MPSKICLRSKWPNYSSGDSDGAAAFDGTNSLYKPQSAVNGGSHDVEGWFPVENAANNTETPRVPYTGVQGTTTGTDTIKSKFSDGSSNTWVTYHGGAGYALQFQASGTFEGVSELYTFPYTGASAPLCSARANQTWHMSWHAYTASGTKNFSIWAFFLDSGYNIEGSTYPTYDMVSTMSGGEDASSGGSSGLNATSGELGFSNRYQNTYTRSSPVYSSSAGGYNFLCHPVADGDYTYYEVFFKVPNDSDIRFISSRLDLDSDGCNVQIDEITLRPMNVSLQDCNGGSGTNISMATVSGN
jgi:hypothetical protein